MTMFYICNSLEAEPKSDFDFIVWVILQHVKLDYIAYKNVQACMEKSVSTNI